MERQKRRPSPWSGESDEEKTENVIQSRRRVSSKLAGGVYVQGCGQGNGTLATMQQAPKIVDELLFLLKSRDRS